MSHELDPNWWQDLPPEAQHDLAERIAANVGYVLTPEPEHPDSPHAKPRLYWSIGANRWMPARDLPWSDLIKREEDAVFVLRKLGKLDLREAEEAAASCLAELRAERACRRMA